MRTYRVKWEIDIEAYSPRDAAEQALDIQQDPESTAVVFDVYDGLTMVTVDLLPDDVAVGLDDEESPLWKNIIG